MKSFSGYGYPILALAEDVLLANPSVNPILDPVDHAILRAVTDQAGAGQKSTRVITLSSPERPNVLSCGVNGSGEPEHLRVGKDRSHGSNV
jgi:hypothetical protein